MTGTGNVTGRAAKTPARKSTASPKTVVKAVSRSTTSRKAAAVEETQKVEQVPELTAADIAVSQEKTETPVAPKATRSLKAPSINAPRPAPTAEPVEQKGNEAVSDVLETTKKVTEEAKDRFQSAFAEASEKAKSGVEKSAKAFEELSDIAKGNVEALVESGRIAAKGLEGLGQEAAEYSRSHFEKASAAVKSLSTARSPAEFFQIQSELFSSSFDSFAKESAKASEHLLKLAGDVVQPISTRVSVVTDKVRSKLSA